MRTPAAVATASRLVFSYPDAPNSRMPRKVARMAKSDGIIARSRAEGLRKMKRNTTKMSAAVIAKLCASVGTRLAPTFAWSSDSPVTRICAPENGAACCAFQARPMPPASAS